MNDSVLLEPDCPDGGRGDPRRPFSARRLAAGLLLLLAAAGASAQDAPAPAVRLGVQRYEVQGATLIDARQLGQALAPWQGPRTLAELQQVLAEVERLYTEAGYGGVKAVLPEQAPLDGVVLIQVVEGRLAEVVIHGASGYSQANIRASLPTLGIGQPLRLRDLDAQLRLANENPGKQTLALVEPGHQTGEISATIKVVEQARHGVSLQLDNTGDERSGLWRSSAGWRHADLTGHDDVFSVQWLGSADMPGKLRSFNAGYQWPAYGQHWLLDLFGAYSNIAGSSAVTTTQSGGSQLGFVGKGRVLGLRARHMLARRGDFDERISVALDHRDYDNRCRLDALALGSCGTGSAAVTPLTLGWSSQRNLGQPLSLALALVHNLGLSGRHGRQADFDAARPGASAAYTVLRADATASREVGEGWRLASRASLQWTPDALLSGEQLGLGGADSVRGYETREMAGDQGGYLSLELSRDPDWPSPAQGVETRFHALVDAGLVHNHHGVPCQDTRLRCAAAAVGMGLRHTTAALLWQADLAVPLLASARTDRASMRMHISARYSF